MSRVPYRIDLAAEIAEVKRELAQRHRFYPGWVAAGKLSQEEADKRTARLAAVLTRLEAHQVAAQPAELPL